MIDLTDFGGIDLTDIYARLDSINVAFRMYDKPDHSVSFTKVGERFPLILTCPGSQYLMFSNLESLEKYIESLLVMDDVENI